MKIRVKQCKRCPTHMSIFWFHLCPSAFNRIGMDCCIVGVDEIKSVIDYRVTSYSCWYARQLSVVMRVLGNTCRAMISSNVCSERSATGINTAFSVPCSLRPKTQWPSCQRPRWNFLCMKFDSSISTTELLPAIWMGWSTHHIAQISRIWSNQFTIVSLWTAICLIITVCLASISAHQYIISRIWANVRRASSKNESVGILLYFLQSLQYHARPSESFVRWTKVISALQHCIPFFSNPNPANHSIVESLSSIIRWISCRRRDWAVIFWTGVTFSTIVLRALGLPWYLNWRKFKINEI